MAMKIFSKPMELQALFTLCDRKHPERAGELFAHLRPQSFYYSDNKEVFSYLTEYAKTPGNDGFPSWDDMLVDTKLPHDVRKKLRLEEGLSTTENTKYLATRLSSMAMARDLATVVSNISESLTNGDEKEDPRSFVEQYQRDIANISSPLVDVDESITSIGTGSSKTRDLLEKILSPDSQPYIPTGFRAFDSRNRGINRGSLHIMAGTSGTGKSLLAGQMVRNMALSGYRVCMVGLEMTEVELLQREMARQTQIDMTTIVKTEDLTRPQREQLMASYDKLEATLSKRQGCIDYFSPDQDLTIEEILYSLTPKGYDAIFIDYVGLLGGLDGADQWKAMKNATRFGKIFARNNNIVLTLLAQLTDDGSLRQSKAMKDDANNMWTWRMTDQQRDAGDMCIRQEKNRNGPMDPFDLHVDWASMSVMDQDHQGVLDDTVYDMATSTTVTTPTVPPDIENVAVTADIPSELTGRTWVDDNIDYGNPHSPLSYRVHDLHDMDYWDDPKSGPCPEWTKAAEGGFVDTQRLYGRKYSYNKAGDKYPVGRYIIPESMRGNAYPADSMGRPLFDKNEDTFIPPEERQTLGFVGLSIMEDGTLAAHFDRLRKEWDEKHGNAPTVEQCSRQVESPDTQSDSDSVNMQGSEDSPAPHPDNLPDSLRSHVYLTRKEAFLWDRKGVVYHVEPSPIPDAVPDLCAQYCDAGEVDVARQNLSRTPPVAESQNGVYRALTAAFEASGTRSDNPSAMVTNWKSIPLSVKSMLLTKKRAKTLGDFGSDLPAGFFSRYYVTSPGDERGATQSAPLTPDTPLFFPCSVGCKDNPHEEPLVLEDVNHLRRFFGIKWYSRAVLAEGRKHGWAPEFVDDPVIAPLAGTILSLPDAQTDTEPTNSGSDSVANNDVSHVGSAPDTQNPQDHPKRKKSIFHYLRWYRNNPEAPGYGNPVHEYGGRENIPDHYAKLWSAQWKAKTIGDLRISDRFPLSRYIWEEACQSLAPDTRIFFPMWLTDSKTGEKEVVKSMEELRALFNIRFLME